MNEFEFVFYRSRVFNFEIFPQKHSARLCVIWEGHLWGGSFFIEKMRRSNPLLRTSPTRYRPIAPVLTDSRCGIDIQLANGSIISLTILLRHSRKDHGMLLIQHGKWNWRRLGSNPILLDGPAMVLIRSHWPVEYIIILIILLCHTRNETPSFFLNPIWKKELDSVGIDPDRIVWHYYGADTIPLSRWRYHYIDYFIMSY